MLDARAIAALHDQLTRDWHLSVEASAPPSDNPAFLERVARQHRANFDLWHTEDEARTPSSTDADLARVKRLVDRTLLAWLAERSLPDAAAELHSESPGLIIDRLSILSLKIFHTREETERTDAPHGHVQRNLDRLRILEEQRADLARCLETLWQQTLSGSRRFKLYRQLKMYNDPTLNPAIYRKPAVTAKN